MGKKKKERMELRFYEVPQNEYVLALVGDSWIREYGHDETNLHFHNLVEIGYCRDGTGELVLNDESFEYRSGMVSIIPQNYPHITISKKGEGPSFWEYLFFEPMQFIAELYPEDTVYQKEVLQRISRRALFVTQEEYQNLAAQVRMVMDEMREKKPHYRESTHGIMLAVMVEMIRISESLELNSLEERADVRKKSGSTQISDALEYVRNMYPENIKIEDLARISHMSETHFRRIFEAYMNMSPMDYINLTRVQAACDLMKKTDDPMDAVAQKVGFTTTSTFNRNFKKFLNTSPYQWKINPENYESKLLNYNISALKGW